MEPEREVMRAFREHKDNEDSNEITTTLMCFRATAIGTARPDVVVENVATDTTASDPVRQGH